MSLLLNYLPLNQITKTKLYYPITLTEAKRHLRIDEDFNQDDDYISGLIVAATRKAEEFIGKDIAYTNNVIPFDNFMSDQIVYDEGNLNSVTSIVTDSSVLITPNKVRTYRNVFYIELPTWIDSNPLTLTFKTGFNVGQIPLDIKQSILIKIADLYDGERSSYTFTSSRDTKAFERMLESYKILIF